MKIIQKVTVKQILTESSKKRMIDHYDDQKALLKKECDQLYFEQKKMEHKNKYQPHHISAYFEQEINLRREKIKLVDFELQQLDLLPLESEVKERELNTIMEVNVGDKWDESMLNKTIIVKDGIVIAIR